MLGDSKLKRLLYRSGKFGNWRAMMKAVFSALAAARLRLTCAYIAGACPPGLSTGADEFQQHAAFAIAACSAGYSDAREGSAY